MSLLLDALKKAADDKKKISQGQSAEPVSDESVPAKAEISEELSLDPLEVENVEADETTDAVEEEAISVEPVPEQKASSSAQNKKEKDASATSYTVSDEALSMLIYKTNRDVKQSRRIMYVSVLLVSLVILISGGIYYYMDMQTEIAALERKHRIAMHSMELKTNKEKIPDNSKIIRNLVGESDLNDKVEYAKKQMAEKKNAQQKKTRPVVVANNVNKMRAASSAVTFQKTNKTDPVTENLEQAWQAYEAGQYAPAKKFYKKVLAIEKDNRDALLGIGAIAVIEKDNRVAREAYVTLLNRDPRDPIAIAALASLRNNAVATTTDEKYLLNMLQRNPEDAHLVFALGNVYAQQGKWKAAQQSYFEAWQRDNENADYVFNLAVSLDQLGKPEQALRFYQSSLSKSVNKQVVFSREAVQKRINELSGL